MARLFHVVTLGLLFIGVAEGQAAVTNPCFYKHTRYGGDDEPCSSEPSTTCVATEPIWGKRYAICADEPHAGAACAVPMVYRPVCCRFSATASNTSYALTTESNEYSCACRGGGAKALFDGECGSPPSKMAVCTHELRPTCCYNRLYDVTYVADNGCLCAASGEAVDSGLCGLPNEDDALPMETTSPEESFVGWIHAQFANK